MEFELTASGKKACKIYKLGAEELCFADLIATGWEPVDAFIVAFRKGATWKKSALKDEVERIVNSTAIQNRIAATKNVLSERQKEALRNVDKKERNEVVGKAMSKEDMLYDLQTAVANLTMGSKEWLDTKKLIVEVTRMKQEEVQNEDTTIKHYLPVRYPTGCQDCLYSRCDTCKYKKAFESKD